MAVCYGQYAVYDDDDRFTVCVFVCVQDRIREMFENLMQVEHPNIVKFHKYWLDMRENRARVGYEVSFIHAQKHKFN